MIRHVTILSLALALNACASSLSSEWAGSGAACKISPAAIMLTADLESSLEDPTIFDGKERVGSSLEIHMANQLAAKEFLFENTNKVSALTPCERDALEVVMNRWDKDIETAQAYNEIDLPRTNSLFVRKTDKRDANVASHRKGY